MPFDPVDYCWEAGEPPLWPRRFVFPIAGSDAGGYSACLDVWIEAPLDRTELTSDDWDRLMCLLLVARLKDRGLREAFESLRDMVEFYSEEPPPALPLAPTQSVRTRVVGSYTSTVPPLAEE